ncbi:unnamed protein product, partial [Vitis vinifera]|uniref:Uncharacterized protein n=1 Tax=Vitis vinifera TaxID=29760 RepID=D7SWV1_VITVI
MSSASPQTRKMLLSPLPRLLIKKLKYGHFVEFLSEMCHIEGTHQIGEKYLLNATQRIQNLKHVI